jgi:hypothetical protein
MGPDSRSDRYLGSRLCLAQAGLEGYYLNPMRIMHLTELERKARHQYAHLLVPHLVSAERMRNLLLSERASFHNH